MITNKKMIVAISGYARSGKDTLGNALLTEFSHRGMTSAKFKFATALKRALTRACGEVGVEADFETEDEQRKVAMRTLMVEFGRYCRGQDVDCFVKATHESVKKLFRCGCQIAIISDLRYRNEGELTHELCKMNGWTYRHIDIERRGTFASNQEELDSIQDLLDATYRESFYRGVSFSDRDFAGINMLAAQIADEAAHIIR